MTESRRQVVISARGEQRVRGGHPWIYRADVVDVKASALGLRDGPVPDAWAAPAPCDGGCFCAAERSVHLGVGQRVEQRFRFRGDRWWFCRRRRTGRGLIRDGHLASSRRPEAQQRQDQLQASADTLFPLLLLVEPEWLARQNRFVRDSFYDRGDPERVADSDEENE